MIKHFLLVLFFCFCLETVSAQNGNFSFVFMTDMHLRPDPVVEKAFNKVVQRIEQIKPDFVLSGGDQIFDIMRGNRAKGDSLFTYYLSQTRRFKVPVYNCVGNHDLFGIYEESPEDSSHPDYKLGMFKRYFGDPYYSFDHKGWHFIVLNVLDVDNYKYIGRVDEAQLKWIKSDLSSVKPQTPVVVVAHIPLVTTYHDLYPPQNGYLSQPPVANRNEVLTLFKDHNLKFVLQGHIHWFEDLNIAGKTHYITGGSIAGRPSWRGNTHGSRGFLKFNVSGGEATYEFVSYEDKD